MWPPRSQGSRGLKSGGNSESKRGGDTPRARPRCPPERGRGGPTWKRQGAPPTTTHTRRRRPSRWLSAATTHVPGTSPARPRHGAAAAGAAGVVGLLIQASQVRHRRVTGESSRAWAGRTEGCRCGKHTSSRKASQLCSASGRGRPHAPAPSSGATCRGGWFCSPHLPGSPDAR